jgi:hypothetical protein
VLLGEDRSPYCDGSDLGPGFAPSQYNYHQMIDRRSQPLRQSAGVSTHRSVRIVDAEYFPERAFWQQFETTELHASNQIEGYGFFVELLPDRPDYLQRKIRLTADQPNIVDVPMFGSKVVQRVCLKPKIFC